MKTYHVPLLVVPLSIFMAVGCGDELAQQPVAGPTASGGPGNVHGDHHSHKAGPHDGTLADWGGGKFHVEFAVDHGAQQATVYILASDVTTPRPIEAEEIQLSIKDPAMQVRLKATPQEGDPDGAASRFVGNHESLGVVQEYEGTITGVVEDTPYSGDFKEEPHRHEA